MPLRRSAASRLRICPLCGSSAIGAAERHEATGGAAWLVCCGECGTWRADLLTRRAARRFARALVRDRERIAHELVRASWVDPALELARLAARRTVGPEPRAPRSS